VECKRDKYDYITPWWLFKPSSSSSGVYRNICETVKVVFGSTLN